MHVGFVSYVFYKRFVIGLDRKCVGFILYVFYQHKMHVGFVPYVFYKRFLIGRFRPLFRPQTLKYLV